MCKDLKEEYIQYLLDKGYTQVDSNTVSIFGILFRVNSICTPKLNCNTMQIENKISYCLVSESYPQCNREKHCSKCIKCYSRKEDYDDDLLYYCNIDDSYVGNDSDIEAAICKNDSYRRHEQ